MKSKYSFDLKYLLSKGHTLCNNIEDYTEAQIYFIQLADHPEYLNNKEKQKKGYLEINNEMTVDEIMSNLKSWKG